MSPRVRQAMLYSALLATGIAVFFAPEEDEPEHIVEPRGDLRLDSAPNVAGTIQASAEALPALTPAKRTALPVPPKDLFHIEPPPSVAAVARSAQPQPPAAPPLPYVYMGKSISQGKTRVFLTRDEKPYVAHLGDILDDQYRIDAINPPVLEFTYLPLAQKQILHIGATR